AFVYNEVFLFVLQKAEHTAVTSCPRDNLLVYEYEGRGSPANSVGCCSLLESEDDLQFLNDLGSKFATLAQICGYSKVTSPRMDHQITPPMSEMDTRIIMTADVKKQTRESRSSKIS